jgi:hypothetical protein
MKTTAAKSAGMETTAVKPTKSAAVETTTMETAAVKSPAVAPSAVASSAATVCCVGEIWLADNSRAQQCSGNAQHTPRFAGPGSAIA